MKSTPCSTAARPTRRGPARSAGSPRTRGPGGRAARALAEAVRGEVAADAEGVAQLRSRHATGSTPRRAGVPGTVFDGRMGEVLGGRVGEIIVLRHGQTEWSRSGQ